MLAIFDDLGSQSAVDAVDQPIDDIVESSNTAGVALVLGIAVGLWTASGYVGAFMRTSNEIYGVEEHRPLWKLRPLQLLITLVMTLILAAVLLTIVLTGPLAEAIGTEVGVGDAAMTAFGIAKWPVLFLVTVGVIGCSIASRQTPATRACAGSSLGVCWRRCSGSLRRPRSASTWPTSAPTPTPTAASPE